MQLQCLPACEMQEELAIRFLSIHHLMFMSEKKKKKQLMHAVSPCLDNFSLQS